MNNVFITIKKIYKYLVKKYSMCLLKLDWRYLLAFFSFSTLAVGMLTTPRFQDGLFHLEVAREWFNTASRPEVVFNLPMAEAPLWYFLVQLMCHAFGGFTYLSAQLLQSLLYAGILIFTYKITYFQTKSGFVAKCALIFAGSIPMLSVTTVLCFIDIICAFFVILSIWLLINEKFLFALLACVGVWYSKRTGIPELFGFFLLFSFCVFHNNKKSYIKTFLELAKYGILFLLLIFPDLLYRITNFNIVSSFAINCKTQSVVDSSTKLIHSANSAQSIPLGDSLLWTGGIFFILILLLPFGIYLLNKKPFLKAWFYKNYILIFIFVLTVASFLLFSLGRVTIRYWSIVIALPIISITGLLAKTKLRSLIIILTLIALVQHCCVMAYICNKRRIGHSELQVFRELRNVPEDQKIVWYEQNFGRYYLRREIYWIEYLRIFLQSEFNSDIIKDNIGAIVVPKRYLYHFQGIYYDRGLPYSLLEKIKKSSNYKLVLENEEYYVFKLQTGK